MAAPTPHFLFYSVDGTGSADWRPKQGGYSHVHHMFERFNPSRVNKDFHEGPGGWFLGADKIVGAEVGSIIDEGIKWIKGHTDSLRSKGKLTCRPPVNSCALELRPSYGIEIVLVGHSRGATVVGDIAKKIGKELKIGVYFLGLFDAVDRSFWSEGGTVENVELTCHAVRNPSLKSERGQSRPSFSNTYRSSNGFYRERLFDTSHGGIGGSPVTDYEKAKGADYSIAGPSKADLELIEMNRKAAKGDKGAATILDLVNSSTMGMPYDAGTGILGADLLNSPIFEDAKRKEFAAEANRLEARAERMRATAKRGLQESKHVYEWMVNQAVGVGLPVS
jgi:hypothetical protein